MMARLTRSMDSFTAACARPTTVVFSRPRCATSTSTSHACGSIPTRMKLCTLASTVGESLPQAAPVGLKPPHSTRATSQAYSRMNPMNTKHFTAATVLGLIVSTCPALVFARQQAPAQQQQQQQRQGRPPRPTPPARDPKTPGYVEAK